MNLKNLGNDYAAELGDMLDKAPKSVIAAVAVSMLTQGGDYIDEARARFLEEWRILHQNGIVPQKPPKQKEKSQ